MTDRRPLHPESSRRQGARRDGDASEQHPLIPRPAEGEDRSSSSHTDRQPENLTIQIHETGTTTEIIASGEWDLAQHRAGKDAIRAVLERRPECVVLDFSQLRFIDSSGIHDLLELQSHCKHQQIHLVIIPAPPTVHRIFEISGLTDLLPFVGSEP